MSAVRIHDKLFVPYIDKTEISLRVAQLAATISDDYRGKNPLFLGILNGSFIFAADLVRQLTIDAEIAFIRLSSYHGTSSTGNVTTAIGLDKNLAGRHVVIIEDIVDTGKTLSAFLPVLMSHQPASVAIAAFLTKPGALKYNVTTDYHAFAIEDRFVVGYGLDYDGHGRNLPDLHILSDAAVTQ